jgi:FkbM family methyltransferase
MNVSSAVAKLVLRITEPILSPVFARAAERHPLEAAKATARVTRLLTRMPSTTGRQVAIYLGRRAPRNTVATAKSNGIDFVLDLRDNLQRDLFYLGDYEGELLSFLLAELRPGDVFIDVGAHIGMYALPAARRVGRTGRVFAFEPSLDTAACLEQNASRNDIENLVIVATALGAAPGTAELRASDSSNYLPEDAAVRSLHGEGPVLARVPVTSFDEWARTEGVNRIDAVKIDVEGSEHNVLRGMRSSLDALRPRILIVEIVAAHLRRAHVTPQMLAEELDALGYHTEGPEISEIASKHVGRFWPNAVLRRDA